MAVCYRGFINEIGVTGAKTLKPARTRRTNPSTLKLLLRTCRHLRARLFQLAALGG
jgi:hypothetical protein